MSNVITYGTFDFFHEGHRRILERAKALVGYGGRLYVGVTSENYDRERGKLNVCQSLMDRIEMVQKSGLADVVFVEEYEGQKIEDIQRYDIDKFVIGDDWEGKFDYLREWCEVVYLPRTRGVSSTLIRNDSKRVLRGGIVGTGRIANRFMVESRFVSGVIFDCVCNPNIQHAEEFLSRHSLRKAFSDYQEMLNEVDVVYIATPHLLHEDYIRRALIARKHVLCEKPLTLDIDEARELYALARVNDVVLQEALKTAFAPGFCRLINLAKGGLIGKIRQVNATFTKLLQDRSLRELDSSKGGGAISELASYVLCPIVKLFGPADADQMIVHCLRDQVDRVETFASGMIRYPDAVGVFTIGLSAKTEGCLTIAGTSGYIFVPSPWWKTQYFEVRNDQGEAVRKIFVPFVGDGLRYELAAFINSINHLFQMNVWGEADSLATLELLIAARNENV